MQVRVIGKNFEITDDVRQLVLEKFKKVDRLLSDFDEDLKEANVTITKRSRFGYKTTFNLSLPGKEKIYSEESHKELKNAINTLKDEVLRQVKEYKQKLQDY